MRCTEACLIYVEGTVPFESLGLFIQGRSLVAVLGTGTAKTADGIFLFYTLSRGGLLSLINENGFGL